MKIIISPAKKMIDHDDFEWYELPLFLNKTEILKEKLQKMDADELADCMKCNQKIAALNYDRFQRMDLYEGLIPALFAYEGLQYQHMAPSVFTKDELEYADKHLVILSGFYGLLRPFDGIRCYRLEMQTRLDINETKSLYDFWKDDLANELFHDNDLVLNLASKEYSQCIEPYLGENRKMITCIFASLDKGKLKVKGTEAKMARGEMVRYMASHQIEDLEEIKKFDYLGYTYDASYSNDKEWVYLKK